MRHPLIQFGPQLRQYATILPNPGRFVALNLLYDYRIPAYCDGNLCDLSTNLPKLEDAVKEYPNQLRQDPAGKIFCSGNEDNIIYRSAGTGDPKGTHLESRMLVTLIKAGSFLRYLEETGDPKTSRLLEQQNLGAPPLGARAEAWAAQLPLDVPWFVALYNSYRRSRARHPVWTADARQFDQVATGAETWLAAVGLPLPPEAECILQFRYPVSAVPVLARPTQLEAGWFAYHFPSPPCAIPEDGGYTLNLIASRLSVPSVLVNEFIHEQIDLDPRYFHAYGIAGPADRKMQEAEIPERRLGHHRILRERYSDSEINSWMLSPNDLPPDKP